MNKQIVLDANNVPVKDEFGNYKYKLVLVDQVGGSHYIKRCVGVPGDKISIDDHGHVLIDGKIAQDKGLKYAMSLDYSQNNLKTQKGYTLVNRNQPYKNVLSSAESFILCNGKEKRQKAEYAAFGDNTENSLDSRYWGKVKQYNLVGPALFSLWPFSHEIDPHWGFIK